MWKKLGNWTDEKNIWETFLFYLIYCAAGIFLCGTLTSCLVNWQNFGSVEEIKVFINHIAPVITGGYTFIVAVLLIWFKKIGKDMLAILFAIVGGLASMNLGLIFGFIPVACISALAPAEKRNETDNFYA